MLVLQQYYAALFLYVGLCYVKFVQFTLSPLPHNDFLRLGHGGIPSYTV